MYALSFKQDRHWAVEVDGVTHRLTDYNDEITGYDDELHNLAPEFVHYGGNAYFVTGALAERNGWRVRELSREEVATLYAEQ